MSKVMDDGKNIYADEMANLRLTEEALAEELADLGVDAIPGVAENRVRL